MFFFFKQKTAYEMRISDWSSDVCSSDLRDPGAAHGSHLPEQPAYRRALEAVEEGEVGRLCRSARASGSRAGEKIHGRARLGNHHQIGRASCRERVCQYV